MPSARLPPPHPRNARQSRQQEQLRRRDRHRRRFVDDDIVERDAAGAEEASERDRDEIDEHRRQEERLEVGAARQAVIEKVEREHLRHRAAAHQRADDFNRGGVRARRLVPHEKFGDVEGIERESPAAGLRHDDIMAARPISSARKVVPLSAEAD